MILGRKRVIDSKLLLDELAAGKRPRAIAAETGVTYQSLRNHLTRYRKVAGFATPEQAVAHHVAEKIRASLPLALQSTVDRAIRRR